MAVVFFGALAGVQARADVIEVPFALVHNEVIVKVMIDGKGLFNSMIDTGTDPSAIDIATAKRIGLTLHGKGQKGSGGGTDVNLAYGCRLPSVGLASLSQQNVAAAAIDLSKVSDKMGMTIDAILGQSFLNKRIVQIDYPGRKVRFLDHPVVAVNGATSATVHFQYKDDVLMEGVVVNGKPVVADLDTGSSGMFQLSPRGTEKLALNDAATKGPASESLGYNGAFENHSGQLTSVSVGTIALDAPPVTFFGKGTGHDKAPWDLNIGNEFMKDYVVTIDYIHKTITFQKP